MSLSVAKSLFLCREAAPKKMLDRPEGAISLIPCREAARCFRFLWLETRVMGIAYILDYKRIRRRLASLIPSRYLIENKRVLASFSN
jgi:hypothetical protein